jgi:hypothetical protein
VRGFTQIYGVDYFNTFSLVTCLVSFRVLMALTACFGWELEAFDFNAVYLNGELNEGEEIFMQEPPGYESLGEFIKLLLKAIYRLKQAAVKWYHILCKALIDLGFHVSSVDPGMFYVWIGEHLLMFMVHVDDCGMTGNSPKLIALYKQKLNDRHALTELGPVNWLLGIKVTHDREAQMTLLSQTAFIESILAQFSLTDVKAHPMLMIPAVTYSKDDSPKNQADAARMHKVPYQEAIGSLMYAAIATRPDITFAVSVLSQFLDNLGEAHWEGVKRIFRYLAGIKDCALTYGEERHDLIGYTDTDGASQPHCRAILGYTFLIDRGAVSWSLKKQELITLSTAEVEYVAATHATKECIWLQCLLGEILSVTLTLDPPPCSDCHTVSQGYFNTLLGWSQHMYAHMMKAA